MDTGEIHDEWANRSRAYSPGYYAYYGPDERSELIREHVEATVDSDAAILEPGCSSGRHLAHLNEHGFRNLHGIEINDDALDVMTEEFPALAETGTLHLEPIEEVVPEFADDRFDVVFSVETLQHLPPDSEWVFAELARITGKLLVTVENEGQRAEEGSNDSPSNGDDVTYVHGEIPLYYRNWQAVFSDLGFREIHSEAVDRDVLRVFQPGDR